MHLPAPRDRHSARRTTLVPHGFLATAARPTW